MTRGARARVAGAVVALVLAGAIGLEAAVLRVPADYPTIRAAVSRAGPGDTVLVDDGTYLESEIEIDRPITVRSRRLYGAVVYGSMESGRAVFWVKAAARIEGFILKGAGRGIVQRLSPDVRWEARDMAILDCAIALSIDDERGNVGEARLERVVVDHRGRSPETWAMGTNDAGGLEVSGSLIMGYRAAFVGYNHLRFEVREARAIDCDALAFESTEHENVAPATSRIEVGPGARLVSSEELRSRRGLEGLRRFVRERVLRPGGAEGAEGKEGAGSAGYADDEENRAARAAMTALIMGRARALSGDLEGAAAEYEAAAREAGRAGNHELVWRARLGRAEIERGRGGKGEGDGRDAGDAGDAALRWYREAIAGLDGWVEQVPVGITDVDFNADKAPVFDETIGLLVERERRESGRGCGAQAFEYAERLKSLSGVFGAAREAEGRKGGREEGREESAADPGTLTSKCTRLVAGIADEPSAGEVDDGMDAAARRIAAAQRRLQNAGLTGEKKEELVAELESAERDYHDELIRRERAERNGRAARPSPLDVEEARRRLDGRALLSYVLGERASYAFLMTEGGLECATLPAARKIEDQVRSYLRFLQLAGPRGFSGANAGRVVFETLLGPFRDRLAGLPKRIVVVTDGILAYLPFETLVVPNSSRALADGPGDGGPKRGTQYSFPGLSLAQEAGRGDGKGDGGADGTPDGQSWRFWGETAEISYAASARQGLAGPRWGREASGGRLDSLLAVGAEDAIRCDNRSKDRKEIFGPLAYVKREIGRLAKAFAGRKTRVLLGSEAGEGAFKRAELDGYAIIHIAAHGVIDDANWWRSALLLEPDEAEAVAEGASKTGTLTSKCTRLSGLQEGEAAGGEDGFLTALEIAELRIRARLVVLSGCSTGAGRLFEGEGIKGLSDAFLRAGAEHVVVSLWSVEDAATAMFMGEFYERLAGGDAPAAALAGTKAWMVERGYVNPFYWAPFVLIGGGTPAGR